MNKQVVTADNKVMIFYACARLGSHTPITANNGAVSAEVAEVSDKLLHDVDVSVATKKSYTVKGLTYNYVTEGGACFLCVADDTFSRRICFAFLTRVKSEFILRGGVDRAFLKAEMQFFSTNPEADKIRNVQAQVDDVKVVMLDNIDKILSRGEKLEDIDRKTDDLRIISNNFQRHTRTLKCALIQQNMKLSIIIAAIIFFILIVLAIIIYLVVKRVQG